MAMHWGSEYLSGQSSTGQPLAGVNALTTSAYCPSSKQPELKHAAVKILKAELPWSLLAMAWFDEGDALAAHEQLKALLTAFPFASCVPFSNNKPLTDRQGERTGLLFRAAAHEAPGEETLALLERIFGLNGSYVLRYADRKKGQRRTIRLARAHDEAELTGFVLAGDTSAQAWITTLLQGRAARAGLRPAAAAAGRQAAGGGAVARQGGVQLPERHRHRHRRASGACRTGRHR